MNKVVSFAALSFLLLVLLAVPAHAVPISILAEGPGTTNAGDFGTVTFTIDYAGGLPGDVETINSITLNLRTPGHDTNAVFANDAAVVSDPFNVLDGFDSSSIGTGILAINFKPLFFDSGENFSFSVGVSLLCAGCATPNSGGAIGFNEVAVTADIAGASLHGGSFTELSNTQSEAIVAATEPRAAFLLGLGLLALVLFSRRLQGRTLA